MLSHNIPNSPWSMVSQEILMWKESGIWSRRAITVIGLKSIFCDVLPNTLTATLVQLTKAHFATLGIPENFITGNVPQFIST